MKILSLDHSAIRVKDVDRSREFYREALLMDEAERPATFNFPGAWFRKGTAEVHIIGRTDGDTLDSPGHQIPTAEPGKHRSFGTHFAFEVEDLMEARAHLIEQGIEIVGEPRPRGDGVQQMYVCDPDGYVIELFAWEEPTAAD